MNVTRHLKPSLFVLAGLAAAASPLKATAAPVYLLLEGTITSNIEQQSCGPNCTSSPYTGQTIKIQATWDDKKIFGADANPAANAGHFRSTAYLGEEWEIYSWTNPQTGESVPANEPHPGDWYPNGSPEYGAHYYPIAGDHTWEQSTNWQKFTVAIGNQFPQTIVMGGPTSSYMGEGAWIVDLATDAAGSVSLSYTTSGVGSNTYRFNFNLTGANSGIFDPQLFGFNWNTSKGGSATGETLASGGHGGQSSSSTNQIAWTRGVLTHNPADLAAVPVPASAWLFGSAVLSLLGGRRLRSKKQ